LFFFFLDLASETGDATAGGVDDMAAGRWGRPGGCLGLSRREWGMGGGSGGVAVAATERGGFKRRV
jgi:hypothetical protein